MPVIFTQIQDQEFARTELLTNIAYLKTNADKLSVKTKLHTYALIVDAIQEYLEAEEDMRAASAQNGRLSPDQVLEAAGGTVEGVGR
jgi:hypothetical protein